GLDLVLAKAGDCFEFYRWDNCTLRHNREHTTIGIHVAGQIQHLAAQPEAKTSSKINEALSNIELCVSYFKDHCVAIAKWFANLLRLVESNNSDSNDGWFVLRFCNGVSICRWTRGVRCRALSLVAWFVSVVRVVYACLAFTETEKFFGLYQKRHSLLPLRCRVFIVDFLPSGRAPIIPVPTRTISVPDAIAPAKSALIPADNFMVRSSCSPSLLPSSRTEVT